MYRLLRIYLITAFTVWMVLSDTRFPGCNLTFPPDVRNGSVFSPNFPYAYPPKQNCVYTFQTEAQSQQMRLCLFFRRFELEFDSSCRYDYLEISSNKDRLCGHSGQGYISNKNLLSKQFPTYCIDYSGSTELKFSTDGTTEKSGFYANFTVTPLSTINDCSSVWYLRVKLNCRINCTGNSYKRDSRGCLNCACEEMCLKKFRCFNREKCIDVVNVCDGKVDCSDGSDESYELAQCSQGLFGCTFENDYCHLNRSSWYFARKLGSSTHRPDYDHTTRVSSRSQGYMAIALVSNLAEKSSLHLTMPHIKVASGKVKCLMFYYHMAGMYNGDLKVELYIGYLRRWQTIWIRSGDHGDVWRTGQIELSQLRRYDLRFTYKKTMPSSEAAAIDDVSLLNGRCLRWDLSCSFEIGDTCGWTYKTNRGGRWKIMKAFGSYRDRTTGTMNGHYLVFWPNLTAHSVSMQLAILTSPPVIYNVHALKCLTFWYFVNSIDSSSEVQLSVWLITAQGKSKNIHPGKYVTNQVWVKYKAEIAANYESYKVELRFQMTAEMKPETLIDEVNIEDGSCDLTSACSQNQFMCKDSQCIRNSQKCDGRFDCGDHSDESYFHAKCSTVTCSSDKWKCRNGQFCVLYSQRCDGRNDCLDNSDENSYSSCGGGSLNVSVIIGVVFAIVIFIIVVNTIIGCICRQRKLRRAREADQRFTQIAAISGVNSAAATRNNASNGDNLRAPITLQPPPYSAVINNAYLPDVLSNGQQVARPVSLYDLDLPPSYDDAMAASQIDIPSYEDAVAQLEEENSTIRLSRTRPKDDSDSGVVNCDVTSTDTINTNLGESTLSLQPVANNPLPLLDLSRTVSLQHLPSTTATHNAAAAASAAAAARLNRAVSLSALEQTERASSSTVSRGGLERGGLDRRRFSSVDRLDEDPHESEITDRPNTVQNHAESPIRNEPDSPVDSTVNPSVESTVESTVDSPVDSRDSGAYDNEAFEMDALDNNSNHFGAYSNDSPPQVVFLQNINSYPSFDI
ncbi:uncharacterized protein LOC141900531 [Tubulanus polymorphus]|uniref:uncharacterized protein LOC141900531 n=1 Tax=Tubulanus polymorphus TaxID=672921 RepID=UPI003DA1E40F